MNIATTNGEKTVGALADRLSGSDAADKTAFRERLLEANPHLADVETLPPGTIVILPDDGTPQAPPAPSTRVEGAYELARRTLDDTQGEIEAALQREGDSAAAGREVLDSEIVKNAAGKNPELAKQREETLRRIAQGDEERKVFSAGIASAVASFKAGLAAPGRRRAVDPPVPPPAGEKPRTPTPVEEKRAETPTPAPPAPPVKDGGPINTLPIDDSSPRQVADSPSAVEAPAEDPQPKTAAPARARKKSVKR